MKDHQPEVWTTRGLLAQFCEIDKRMADRAFAFIIGAGASVPSGIDSGSALVQRWLEELKTRLCHNDKLTMEEWANEANLGIEGFDYSNAASFYPQVFERRFRGHYDEGFACLEEIMEGKEPSIGYSVLAKVLADTRHKVVITTNFDNLVADALATYTMSHPLVAGHESLSGFVSTTPRRPLVAKIHRDLFLAPINDAKVDSLQEGWEKALMKLFSHYTPIVLGYGGNDGSLMKLLQGLPEGSIPGGIFWCHRKNSQPTDHRILEVVTKQHGKLVPIIGFDEFMLELGGLLGYPPLADALERQGKERVKRYKEQFESIHKRINEDKISTDEDAKDLKKSINATAEKQTDWWGWQLRINEENDPDAKEQLYREAVKAIPNSYQLIGNFANFMKDIRKEYDEAERLYRRALELDSNHANTIGNFALFMNDIRKDYDEAERLYRRALELDPNHANSTGNFAIFMECIRKDYDKVKQLYRQAVKLEPNNANRLSNFAVFMSDVCKEYGEAEQHFRRALELDDANVDIHANYAALLLQLGRYDEARKHAERVCQAGKEPSQALAEALLYLTILARLTGEDELIWLRRLKGVLLAGYSRGNWSFDTLFNSLNDRLEVDVIAFYRKIGDAILNEAAFPELEQDKRWQVLDPLAP